MRILLFILTICIVISGCVEGNNVAHSNESVNQGQVNITPENLPPTPLLAGVENIQNIPEIKIKSFSSIYTHTNLGKVYEYLFCWDNVPGSGNQEFIKYVEKIKEEEKEKREEETPDSPTDDLKIIGQKHSLNVKSDDNKTIRVYFISRNETELTLEDRENIVLKTPYDIELKLKEVNENHNVLLTPQTLQIDELEGKEVNGKLCIYKVKEKGYNITEKCYAVYNLSIKNNDSKSFDFKLNDLKINDGNHIFNATTTIPESIYSVSDEILSNLGKETKIEDTTLFPGQTINGSVFFQVGSLYDESFSLMYNGTPISSASFNRSIKALRTTESYNYSAAFGIPPYTDYSHNPPGELFEPKPESYPDLFANWVNRKVFEFYNKYDSESVRNTSSDYICETVSTYALKVIPERNVTMIPKTCSSEYYHLVVDETGEELINRSYFSGVAIFRNESCFYYKDSSNCPQMNFSNATIVRISYRNLFNTARLSYIDQYVILDDKLNIAVAAHNGGTFTM